MSFFNEIRKLRKQEAWIAASLFTSEERRRYRRHARLRGIGVLSVFVLAHFFMPWWVALSGLIAIFVVSIWRYENWDRRRYIRAFFNLRRDVGSASTLTGTVHYAVMFVRPKHRAKNQVRHALGEVETAFAYLQQEAKRWGKTVTFKNVLEDRLHIVLRRPKTVGRNLLKSSFTKELGKKIGQMPVADMATNKNFFIIVFTSGGDYRACAVPRSRLDEMSDDVEYCVCPDGETAITVAHEILHLFGARDLYIEGENEDESWRLRNEMVKRAREYADAKVFDSNEADISMMANPVGDLVKLKVMPATAYSVGWLDKLPEPIVRSE